MKPSHRHQAATALAALTLLHCKGPQPKDGPEAASATTTTSTGPGAAAPSAAAGSTAASEPTAPKGPSGPLNVILLTIDSLRQDMPWTGYSRPIAPNLTRLAAESVVYTHAYAGSSTTPKSIGTLLGGRLASTLYRSGVFFAEYSLDNLFVQEVLQEKGVRTIGLQAHKYFDRGKRIDQGFDVWQLTPGITFDSETDKNVTSDKMTDLAIKVLGDPANTGKPFFAWMHYMDPHDEYIKHAESPDFGKKNRDRYDSEVFFTDLHVGRLLEWAKEQPWWGKTAVIVSADHGEAFGEHGVYKHAFTLWEVVTRVPLVVYAPGAKPQRIDLNRSHVDIAATVLELAGVKDKPEAIMGRSLVGEIYGTEPPDIRDPIFTDLPEDSHNPAVRAMVRGSKKLISYADFRWELYDLETDPEEKTDLSKTDKALLDDMKAEYKKLVAAMPVVPPYGGNKLREGGKANGPTGPKK